MPYKYSVFSGFGQEEVSGTRYDSIGNNDLTAINDSGRRPAKFNYGADFETFLDSCRHTLLQSEESAFNQTTFSTWFFFDSDVPLNDNILLGRYNQMSPIWSIGTLSGHIGFTIGDGISSSHTILGPQVLQGSHFVAITYNDTTGEMLLYFDGAVVATGGSEIYMAIDAVGISYSNPIQPFNGWQDVAIWTELVVSPTDLDTIYNNGVGHDILWYFDLTNLSDLRCIYRNKVIPLYRQEVKTFFRNRVKTLEANK